LRLTQTSKRFKKKSKGAAAYKKSEPPSWLTFPCIATYVLIAEVLFMIVSPTWRTSVLAWVIFGTSIPLAAWLSLRFIMLQKVLTVPRNHWTYNSEFQVEEKLTWDLFQFKGWGGDTVTGKHLQVDNEANNLLVYLHGYGSDISSCESRIKHISKMGVDVVGMNMRGHGNCELRYDWTLLKAVADVEALLGAVIKRYENPPKRVWIYGHSAGGFVGLRLASHPSGWWAENLKGIILESPATSFPLIIESITPPFLRPVRGWIRQILRREFERIHPDLGIRYANSAVPYFGMPEVPMLVLQANTDSRLGLKHYELLMKHIDPELSTVHLLEELEHSSTKDNVIRQKNLEKWLKPQLQNNGEALT
jgi:pimeloyl-ACP methyl ester carboxylesterase